MAQSHRAVPARSFFYRTGCEQSPRDTTYTVRGVGVTYLMDQIAALVLVAGSAPILHVPRVPLGLPRTLPVPLPMPDAGLAPGIPDTP